MVRFLTWFLFCLSLSQFYIVCPVTNKRTYFGIYFGQVGDGRVVAGDHDGVF